MGKQDRKALQRSETHQKIKQLKAKTANQADYIDSLHTANQIIVYGPPGTGKTYMAAARAGDLFASRQINKIILTRPAVAVDQEDLGFLPGELDEKFQQWAIPLTEVIKQRIGPQPFKKAVAEEAIQTVPLGYMDGRTFHNSFVIFDEAENATFNQMKVFLTRIGQDSQVVINGDIEKQYAGSNALRDIIYIVDSLGLAVDVIEFGPEDIVRSPETAMWVDAISKYEKGQI